MFGLNKLKRDIEEIKLFMGKLVVHFGTEDFENLIENVETIGLNLENIKETIDESLDTTEEYSQINIIQEKLNNLLEDENREEKVRLARATLDKFEDYMKNVDKLNVLVNEIKGIAAMTRASLKSTQAKPKKSKKQKVNLCD